jgi:hypothetical protein
MNQATAADRCSLQLRTPHWLYSSLLIQSVVEPTNLSAQPEGNAQNKVN